MPLPNPPKLHLNEHLSPRLSSQLQKHGFDITTSQQAELLPESDEKQLAYAASQQRAIVTFNIGDFSRLHNEYQAEGKEHGGVISQHESQLTSYSSVYYAFSTPSHLRNLRTKFFGSTNSSEKINN